MNTKRQMKIGLSIRRLGYHTAAWRLPEIQAGGAEDFTHFLKQVQAAERAKLDFVFLADNVAIKTDGPPELQARSSDSVELEPLTLLSALAPLTKHIGLIATASTSYDQPYHIARRFASLDHISGGRAAWNVVTSWSEQEAWNFSREQQFEHAFRYERAKEFVEVVTGLWDSWESDAFLHDKESGVFYDHTKKHVLGHKGKHFQVRGPLNASRTPQGRPIIVQAGGSDAGQELAAPTADLVYTNDNNIADARRFYAALKARVAKAGRNPDEVKIAPGFQPFIGRTREEARVKLDRLVELIHPDYATANLAKSLGDLSGYDPDGPFPTLSMEGRASNSVKMYEMAHKEKLTIRQLGQRAASRAGVHQVIGTPKDVADAMEEWFTTGAADAFNIAPAYSHGILNDLAEFVLPELRRRGLFRTDYEGTTLRRNLGLPDYVNRHERDRMSERRKQG